MASERAILQVLRLIRDADVTELPAAKARAIRAYRHILDSPNVSGFGIAFKDVDGKRTRQLALTFYVVEKRPLKTLRGDEVIPPMVHGSLAGRAAIPTDVVESGPIELEAQPRRARS